MSELRTEADVGVANVDAPLDFEAWADLSARLMGLDRKAQFDILDEVGVDVEDWTRCERHYALAIGDDIAHGRMDRAKQYARRCAEEMERRRAAERVTTQTNGGAVPEPAVKGGDGAPKMGAPLEEGPIDARFLNAPPAPPAPGREPPVQFTTAAAFELPAELRALALALPFKPIAAPSLPTFGGTAHLPHQAPLEPSRPEGTAVLGATAPLDPAMVKKAALPFAAEGAAPTPAPVTGAPPKAVAYPRMPLPTYAALCAELTAYPHHVPEIRKRYGIEGDAAHAALDDAWRTRLGASAEVRAECEALVRKYLEGLRPQSR